MAERVAVQHSASFLPSERRSVNTGASRSGMNKLAIRPVEQAEIETVERAQAPSWSWLPDEARLAMPVQSLAAPDAVADLTPATSPRTVALRRLALLAGTIVLTGLSAITPFYLYARKGWDGTEILAFSLFMVLITAISCWFVSGLMGLFVMLRGKDQQDLAFSPHPPMPRTRTALLMPLYNEDARASFARLAMIDQSLARLGAASAFDIFVLSDSTKDEAAAAERSVFQAFRLTANSKAYYRRRTDNAERKAGNLAEWVRRFGGAYENMIVLDADSTMAGETLLRMVDAMERNPGVGLIQTAPVIIKARTIFARVSQYSVRLYGRVAAAGLAYWTGSESSYWGHNAIIRTRAFAACCGLPHLKGRKPFGGHIMSHDVVEAALMRRAGWAVHVTASLDGSWEETPPSITDFIRRDHRWFQGNLQHLGLITAKGLSPMSRLQLLMGCMAYLSSPLWLGLADDRPVHPDVLSGRLVQLLLHPEPPIHPLHAGLLPVGHPADRAQIHGRGPGAQPPGRAARLRRAPRHRPRHGGRDRPVRHPGPHPDGRQHQGLHPDRLGSRHRLVDPAARGRRPGLVRRPARHALADDRRRRLHGSPVRAPRPGHLVRPDRPAAAAVGPDHRLDLARPFGRRPGQEGLPGHAGSGRRQRLAGRPAHAPFAAARRRRRRPGPRRRPRHGPGPRAGAVKAAQNRCTAATAPPQPLRSSSTRRRLRITLGP